MIVHRFASCCLVFSLILSFLPSNVAAHGGVVEEDDLCVIQVNYLRAHFKVYQPGVTGHEQYCEDLPVAAESIFVMEYQHDLLSKMQVDFRIIRDVTGKGRFARMVDVNEIDDIDSVTVFYQAPIVEPDVYRVNHEFREEGDFIGIVSAKHPTTGKVYEAVFPFEVGFTGLGYWPLLIGLLVLIQLQYLFMIGRLKAWFGKGTATGLSLAVVLFLFPLPVLADDLVVTYTTPDGARAINQMHSWILHVETDQGVPIEEAIIDVEGGMPAHDHGLPTKPRVTEELGNGDYRLDGMRFHMSGSWEIVLTVTTEEGTTIVIIPMQL